MSNLRAFKINTYKNFCTFCISLISRRLKSTIINTSTIFDFNPSIINTSDKTGGGGLPATPVATGDAERASVIRLSYVAEAFRLPSWFDEKRLEA